MTICFRLSLSHSILHTNMGGYWLILGEEVAHLTHLQVYWAEKQRDETEGRFQVWIFWSLCRVAMNINYLRHVDVTHKQPIIFKNFSGWSWRIIRTSWWSFSKWRPEIDSSSSPLSNFESKKRISHFRQLSFAHYSTPKRSSTVSSFTFLLSLGPWLNWVHLDHWSESSLSVKKLLRSFPFETFYVALSLMF